MDNNQLFIGIDFETANSNPLSACSIGLVVFLAGEVIFEFESLIKPPKKYGEFLYFNTTIHKITASDVKDAKTWLEVYPLIKPYLDNSLIVAHNARFDINVFKTLNEFYGLNLPNANYFCSVDLAREVLPYLSNHKLNTVSDFLEINLNHHNAKSDAIASAMIVYRCMILTDTLKLTELLEKVHLIPKKLII
ncbi:MAG: 3'-5' exonuclease [Erysipelothrix sp.]|nr:3'-5' exonuclease [Erysipelothrix sp.]